MCNQCQFVEVTAEPPVDAEVLVDVLWIPAEDTGLCCSFEVLQSTVPTDCDLVVSATLTERGEAIKSVKAIA